MNFNILNFAFYNGLAVASFVVVCLYGFFIYQKIKQKQIDWSFEFSIGIFIATFSVVIEKIYYGYTGAIHLIEESSKEEMLSPQWIISAVAIIGTVGLLYHVKSLTKYSINNGIFKGAIWITLGTICASAFWGFLL